MGIITEKSQFIGFYMVPSTCYDELDNYIAQFEQDFLEDLLGCDLFDLFQADLVAGVPQTQRFIDLFDPFCIDSDDVISFSGAGCNKQWKSKGMIDMVTGLIYFMYVRDEGIRNTPVGKVINAGATSENVQGMLLHDDINERWNRAVESYQAIQYRITKNSSDYPEFKGMEKEFLFFGGAF